MKALHASLGTSLRVLRAIAAWTLLAAGLFMLSALLGSSIPRNRAWREPSDGIEIMVAGNAVHTEIVVPLVTPEKDWRTDFPASDIPVPDRDYTHLAISWGEREVFLHTPTWGDLSPRTAAWAALDGSPLLHVEHFVRPAPDDDFRPLRLTSDEYARLVRRIEAAVRQPPGPARQAYRGYADYDAFYDARGRYSVALTCNQWTSDMLAAAGVRIGWWTPFAGGVMKWIPRPSMRPPMLTSQRPVSPPP
ncbi:TIGR02117 family protein [Novosphingobium lentum]|uniref:TIGR02117 family protein n=1 Tax=Novosphingobium lentum TaxID=145287 RepID=UPI000AB0B35F|nr:TIGR02117 family protein [Novosphingobium lentum]